METEKRDFENLDVRLYLALKAVLSCTEEKSAELLIKASHSNDPEIKSESDKTVYAVEVAYKTLRDFENSFGPVPDWAVRRNFAYELIPGAQLCTRDGRITGNAHILRMGEGIAAGPVFVPTFDCITDAGSYIKSMTEQELLNQFWVGDYISDPKTLIARFGNHGEDYGLPEMPQSGS